MKMKASVVIGLFLAAALASHAQAAAFDGAWEATGPAQSASCPGVNIHFDVKGNGFASTIGTVKFTYHFRGAIAADGSFDTKSPGGTAHIAGKFSGNDVTLTFNNDQCPSPRPASGKRLG